MEKSNFVHALHWDGSFSVMCQVKICTSELEPGTRSIRWQIAPESDRGACKTARPKDRVDKEERSNKHLLLDPMVVYTCIQIEKSYFLTIAGQTPLVCKLRVMSSALCQKSSLYWFLYRRVAVSLMCTAPG